MTLKTSYISIVFLSKPSSNPLVNTSMNKKQSSEFYITGKGKAKIIIILGILTAYVPFSIDTYLPAMTHIADYFGTTSAKMTFSLTTFFIGFATGQILYGPLLDLYGRKLPLYFGLGN